MSSDRCPLVFPHLHLISAVTSALGAGFLPARFAKADRGGRLRRGCVPREEGASGSKLVLRSVHSCWREPNGQGSIRSRQAPC